MKRYYIVNDSNREHICQQVCEQVMTANIGDVVHIEPPKRTLEQNALLWPYLQAFERQLPWPVLINGQWERTKLSDWDWKDLLTGSFEGDMRRMAQGTDGSGLIMLGTHTSGYSKAKFSDFIEFMNAFGAQYNVDLRHPQAVIRESWRR